MAIDPINFARTTQVRLRRGTTGQIAANPPVEAEPFYDLTSQRMGIGGGSDGIVEQWKSEFLEHTADATDAVPRNMQEKLDEIISVKDFGAVGDGVTDDAPAIRDAVYYVATLNQSVSGKNFIIKFPPTEKSYKINSTIILPFGLGTTNDAQNGIVIDMRGAVFLGSGSSDSDHDLFESGYLNGTTPTTSIGTTGETRLAYNVKAIGGFFKNFRRVFYLQNWNQGCGIQGGYARNCQQAIYATRCFYMFVRDFVCRGAPDADTKACFEFQTFANIMNIVNLCGDSHATIFRIGGADGLKLTDCAIENATNGVVLSGECNMISFDNCYMENCSNSAIKIESTIREMIIQNTFINLSASNLIDSSSIGNSDYANITFIGNRYLSGDFTLGSNVYGSFIGSGSAQGIGGQAYPILGSPKITNYAPEFVVDSSASGYNGPPRFCNISQGAINQGFYKNRFGDGFISSNRSPFQTVSIDPVTDDMTIDTQIDFTANVMGTWFLVYAHSLSTFRGHFLIQGQPGVANAVYLFAWNGSAYVRFDGPNYTVSNNAGKIRLVVSTHTTKTLERSIIRIF